MEKTKIILEKKIKRIYLVVEFGFEFPSTMISSGDIYSILTTTKHNLGSRKWILCSRLLHCTRKNNTYTRDKGPSSWMSCTPFIQLNTRHWKHKLFCTWLVESILSFFYRHRYYLKGLFRIWLKKKMTLLMKSSLHDWEEETLQLRWLGSPSGMSW